MEFRVRYPSAPRKEVPWISLFVHAVHLLNFLRRSDPSRVITSPWRTILGWAKATHANTLSCACPACLSVLQSKEAPKRRGFSISCHFQIRSQVLVQGSAWVLDSVRPTRPRKRRRGRVTTSVSCVSLTRSQSDLSQNWTNAALQFLFLKAWSC